MAHYFDENLHKAMDKIIPALEEYKVNKLAQYKSLNGMLLPNNWWTAKPENEEEKNKQEIAYATNYVARVLLRLIKPWDCGGQISWYASDTVFYYTKNNKWYNIFARLFDDENDFVKIKEIEKEHISFSNEQREELSI